MHRHESVNIRFGGTEAPFNLNALRALKTSHPPQWFNYLTKDCHPNVAKSRRHSTSDNRFIVIETKCFLLEGIIERSSSLWRAQVLINTSKNYNKRICIHYCQTMNKFTLLDGYPLLRMHGDVSNVLQYNVFSTLDLQSVYHIGSSIYEVLQVEFPETAKIFIVFETNFLIYETFGLKKCCAFCFQRIIDNITEENNC